MIMFEFVLYNPIIKNNIIRASLKRTNYLIYKCQGTEQILKLENYLYKKTFIFIISVI